MNRVLIVEDEKMIRQGIVAMIKRIDVPIKEIKEARNGEEALSILEEYKIDLMITDIRMPKMDGITLVKSIKDSKDKPKVIVISGYDDFNYAVEVLRQGVRDYLLKPIEREKLAQVLKSIDLEIEQSKEQHTVSQKIAKQQLKYMLLNEKINETEIVAIEKKFELLFPSEKYVVCCFGGEMKTRNEKMVLLDDVEGYSLLLLETDLLERALQTTLKDSSVGISKVHKGIAELRLGYKEAIKAREEAFAKCVPFVHYEEKEENYEIVPEDFSEQFVQVFGTNKIEEVLTRFANIRFKVKANKIASTTLLEITNQILEKLLLNYDRIIEFDQAEFENLKNPLYYRNATEYYALLEDWIRKMQQVIIQEFDDYKNKEKINMAIQYIKSNFKNDLNMAVVSNHISMNYSLFSLNFKQFTGMNFVNYLKRIRIDEAKRLLETTDEKIIHISQMIGYDNEKHFMKIFKNVCGVSPSEYRKNSLLSNAKNIDNHENM